MKPFSRFEAMTALLVLMALMAFLFVLGFLRLCWYAPLVVDRLYDEEPVAGIVFLLMTVAGPAAIGFAMVRVLRGKTPTIHSGSMPAGGIVLAPEGSVERRLMREALRLSGDDPPTAEAFAAEIAGHPSLSGILLGLAMGLAGAWTFLAGGWALVSGETGRVVTAAAMVSGMFFGGLGFGVAYKALAEGLTRRWIVLEPERMVRYRKGFGRRRHVLDRREVAAVERVAVSWGRKRNPEPEAWSLRVRVRTDPDAPLRWVGILDGDADPERSAWLGARLAEWSGMPLSELTGGLCPTEIVGTEE